ncbi:uncharacterized protein C2845_PM11G18920 [Panicum miliaceum]|uniref:VQ domain-containing protein n=1 Tax=Panicum miliaceum TaxID=4540 RepID=A0A3L6RQE9_PANMI|nr:uncharacterized protein C2845_PM11G18920 [Panicum miliaceum]
MEKRIGGGVKVTYIETRFVTSDAAGFKDLVQRLTGRSPAAGGGDAPAPAAAPHRPHACRAAASGGGGTIAAAGAGAPQGYYYRPVAEVHCPAVAGRAPPYQEDLLLGMDDFSDLFYVGACEQRRHGISGGYSDFRYY